MVRLYVRARAERFLLGEVATKSAHEKRYAHKNTIVEIERDGALCKDQASIERRFCDYYEKVFARRYIDAVQFKNEFICLLPCLSEEKAARIESGVAADEVRRAVDELSPGKTPGPDGLTAAFYKKFKDGISPVPRHVYAELYKKGVLPPSFLVSHAVFIPQSEDKNNLRHISAYRPVSLTNVDYKVLMKILASRL